MEFIVHRINTVEELRNLPEEYGVELDLRDSLDGTIYIRHNPFEPGENFEDYLKEYHHGTMILNIKSERIEWKVLELIREYNVKKYFFLDSSFPMIYLLSSQGEKNIALRISELEGMETVRNMAGKVGWVWVDCFTKIPITKTEYYELKAMGYRLCFVSPELEDHGQDIEKYRAQIEESGIEYDAICVKYYNVKRWRHNQ